MKNRKIPMRRCVGCMTSKPKRELVRIVAADIGVMIDRGGKANGRGVYLCSDMECLDKALKRNSITRGLGIEGLRDSVKDELRAGFTDNIPDAEV
jgi:predicted RNA-binding protein YlxR (DUF448 family)